MAIFKTTDNNGGKQLQTISHEYEKIDFKAAVNDIKIISNKTLAELAAEENLLIFPIRLDDSADLLNHSKICSLSKSDKEEGYIFSTENVAGFIGINDTDISITSRFAITDALLLPSRNICLFNTDEFISKPLQDTGR